MGAGGPTVAAGCPTVNSFDQRKLILTSRAKTSFRKLATSVPPKDAASAWMGRKVNSEQNASMLKTFYVNFKISRHKAKYLGRNISASFHKKKTFNALQIVIVSTSGLGASINHLVC